MKYGKLILVAEKIWNERNSHIYYLDFQKDTHLKLSLGNVLKNQLDLELKRQFNPIKINNFLTNENSL